MPPALLSEVALRTAITFLVVLVILKISGKCGSIFVAHGLERENISFDEFLIALRCPSYGHARWMHAIDTPPDRIAR